MLLMRVMRVKKRPAAVSHQHDGGADERRGGYATTATFHFGVPVTETGARNV